MPGLIHAAGETPLTLAGTNLTLVIVVAVIAVVALIMGVVFRRQVLAADPGTAKMQEIGQAVEEGAHAYLARQFKTLSVFVVIVFFLLMALPADTAGIRFGRSGFFVLGAIFSAAVGYFGMSLAVKANVRVASAANNSGRDVGMRIAFRTGGTVGMMTVGLGLLGAASVVLLYKGDAPKVLEGFGFGAALLAMFMRVGGGIFTKAADVGADLVGKVEAGIPEDDPRNAATIADNVGDNVGDCAGMAADLFESYAVTLVAALILGKAAFGEQGLVFPLIVPAIGALTAILGVYITKPRPGENGLKAINRGFYISAAVSAVLSAVAAFVYLPAKFSDLVGVSQAIKDLDGNPTAQPPIEPAQLLFLTLNPRIAATLAVFIGIALAGSHPHADRTLHRHRQAPHDGRCPNLADRCGHGRAVRHRRRPRVRGLHHGHHRLGGLPRLPARWRIHCPVAVPDRAGRLWSADHGRRHRRDGHLRPGLGQRPGHRRDVW